MTPHRIRPLGSSVRWRIALVRYASILGFALLLACGPSAQPPPSAPPQGAGASAPAPAAQSPASSEWVVGIADDLWGELVVAAVVPAAGHELEQDALDALARSQLAGYKVPRRYVALPALPRNAYGKGEVAYVGFMPTDAMIEKILAGEARRAGVEVPQARFPMIVRRGALSNGHAVRYVLNYSAAPQRYAAGSAVGTELLSGRRLMTDQFLVLPPWGVAIIEETGL